MTLFSQASYWSTTKSLQVFIKAFFFKMFDTDYFLYTLSNVLYFFKEYNVLLIVHSVELMKSIF